MKRFLSALLVLLAGAAPSSEASLVPPKSMPGVDGIFAAFQSHPLVGMGEMHYFAQELDFYAAVLRDPRFADEVGNVVLEVGDAAQQDVIDRYENGEDVPYLELRKVWTDTVGWAPTVMGLGSINIYAVIREVNRTRPVEKRIKVWLGEPPIDWSQIKSKEDLQPLTDQRNSFPAALIQREILAKGKKALVIYGMGHLAPIPGPPNIRMILDSMNPGALYVVAPYVGFTAETCTAPVETVLSRFKSPTLFSPVIGSSLQQLLDRPGCNIFTPPPGASVEQKAIYLASDRGFEGLSTDALLYLGTRKSMTLNPFVPDIYLDGAFRKELERRMQIMLGKAVPLLLPAGNTASPMPYW
ncbi:MAG: hypothetical protein ABI963_07905 [Rhizomicrobium sp.]